MPSLRLILKKILPLVATLLLASGAGAQAAWPYVAGSVGFHYQQFPFPVYSGNFAATESVGGFFTASQDTATAMWYAAVAQTDSTVDLAMAWVRKPGATLPVGSYPIDVAGRTVLFAYVDELAGFTVPGAADLADPAAWLAGLRYGHLFLAVTGTVRLTALDQVTMAGTFSGTAADTGLMIISVSNGTFALEGMDVPVEASSWGDLKAAYR